MNSEYMRHLPAEQLLPLVERELGSEAGLGRVGDTGFGTRKEERFKQNGSAAAIAGTDDQGLCRRLSCVLHR